MPRTLRAAMTVGALASILLVGCAPTTPGTSPERPAAGGEAPVDDRGCLIDHSPWSLDIGRLLDDQVAFLGSVAAEGAPSSWSAEGAATMTFTDAAAIWQFQAEGVVFTLSVPASEGAVVVRSAQAEEQNGEYRVVPGGFFTVDAAASLTHVDDTSTTFPDGSVSAMATSIGTPPVFPWSRDIVTGETSVTYAFTCTPTELVISTSAPYDWHFVPGR